MAYKIMVTTIMGNKYKRGPTFQTLQQAENKVPYYIKKYGNQGGKAKYSVVKIKSKKVKPKQNNGFNFGYKPW